MKITWPRLRSIDDILHLLIKLSLVLALLSPLLAPIFSGQMENFSYYFPFIVPRNLYWRLLVEIALGAYLFLILKHKITRPQLNKAYTLFVLFVTSLFIASLFGQNFIFSFWSNFERMDGLVNWLHLLAYVFVLASYLGYHLRSWQYLMQVSVMVAVFVALNAIGQQLELNWLLASAGGSRLTASLGNAAYVGSYLFLHLVVLTYLLIKNFRQARIFRVINLLYILSAILFLYVLMATETRGPFLALIFFAVFMLLSYLWFQRQQKNWFYYLLVSLFLALIVFFVLLFTQKQSNWVKSVPVFAKISTISVNDTTTASRLFIWQKSLTAAKEKPIFGWGEENFIYAFNKYFPTQIYRGAGSETWFDRPHNILVQHLIHGGVIALGLYLSIFIYLIILLYRNYQKDKDWLLNFVWIGFLLSFLLQDLFIFDNLSVSVVFYLLLAFLIANLDGKFGGFWSKFHILWSNSRLALLFSRPKHYRVLFPLLALLLLWTIKEMVYDPYLSNKLLIKALRNSYRAENSSDFKQVKADWEKSVRLTSLGDKEKVEVLLQILQSVLNNTNAGNEDKKMFFVLTGTSFESMSEKYPNDVRFNMILASFYGNLAKVEPSFLQKKIDLLKRLQAYAPQRPDIQIALTDAYLQIGDVSAATAAAMAAKDLAPDVKDVYWNLAYLYFKEKNIDDLEVALKKITVLNLQNIGSSLEQGDLARLNYLVAQLDPKKDAQLYEMINNFIPKI